MKTDKNMTKFNNETSKDYPLAIIKSMPPFDKLKKGVEGYFKILNMETDEYNETHCRVQWVLKKEGIKDGEYIAEFQINEQGYSAENNYAEQALDDVFWKN